MRFSDYVRSINGQPTKFLEADKGGSGGSSGGSGEGGTGGSDGGSGGSDGGAGSGNPSNSLDELMKDPAFKAQYEAKMKEQLGKRMKKYENVDPEEYARLKAEEDKKKQDEMTEAQKLQAKIDKMEADQQKIAEREKDIVVKEYAINEGLDPKLVARLIDKSGIKKEGDEFTGVEEAFKAVQEEFPQLFQGSDGGEGGNNQNQNQNQGGRFNLPNQRGNNPPKKKGYDAGKARAEARHKKQ
jgi:hypothetical protein